MSATALLLAALAAAAPAARPVPAAVRPAPRTFEAEQRAIPRVRRAFDANERRVRRLFHAAGAFYPPRAIYLRVFKEERVVELWAESAQGRYLLVQSYDICAASGRPGPKRREGDEQVPEGFYRIVHFNPLSEFHLSLGLDYPNASDRRLAGPRPGGAIYLHGNCVSIGCIAITDGPIEEVYVAAVLASSAGQERIPIHVFPARLTDANLKTLEKEHAGDAALLAFWRNLREGYDRFERNRRPPRVEVDAGGRYVFR
jgi:murein L,D-transpeptidase YafK